MGIIRTISVATPFASITTATVEVLLVAGPHGLLEAAAAGIGGVVNFDPDQPKDRQFRVAANLQIASYFVLAMDGGRTRRIHRYRTNSQRSRMIGRQLAWRALEKTQPGWGSRHLRAYISASHAQQLGTDHVLTIRLGLYRAVFAAPTAPGCVRPVRPACRRLPSLPRR